MSQVPHVAVVILNCGQVEATIACLESIAGLEYQSIQVVLVDNGVGIMDGEVLSRFGLSGRYGVTGTNLGCAGGRNFALKLAAELTPNYVLFLDNDAILDRHSLTKMVEVGEADHDVGVIGPAVLFADKPERVWSAGGEITHLGFTPVLSYDSSIDLLAKTWKDVAWVPGCALLAKWEVIDEVGGFFEDYFIYYEDIEWCLETGRKGYRVVVNPNARVYHSPHGSSRGEPALRAYYMTRNRLKFVSRSIKVNVVNAVMRVALDDLRRIVGDVRGGRYSEARESARGIWDFMLGRRGPRSRRHA